MATVIALETWAGRRYYRVEVVGETPKRIRVKVTHPGGVRFPGGRYVPQGKTTLVPKYALRDLPEGTEKIEHNVYEGRIYGYGCGESSRRLAQ